MKRIGLIAIVAVAIAGLVYYFVTRGKEEEGTFIKFPGT